MFIAAGRRRLWPATQARARRIYRPCDPLSPSRGTRARAVVAGARTTPAVVALASNGEWIVGEAARAQAAKNRSGTVTRLLSLVNCFQPRARATRAPRSHRRRAARHTQVGQSLENPAIRQELDAASLEASDDKQTGKLQLNLRSGGPAESGCASRQCSPEALLTILFKHLRLLAEEFVGGPLGPAVVTVPASFSGPNRDVLLQASRQAGFDVLQALIEPCAVALAHGLDQPDDDDDDDEDEDEEEDDDDEEEEEEAIVLVIDIGSTQLDVTLMKEKSGLLRVEKTHCDVELGGQHFAGKLAQHCIAQFKRQYGSDPSESPKAIAKLSGVRLSTLFGFVRVCARLITAAAAAPTQTRAGVRFRDARALSAPADRHRGRLILRRLRSPHSAVPSALRRHVQCAVSPPGGEH